MHNIVDTKVVGENFNLKREFRGGGKHDDDRVRVIGLRLGLSGRVIGLELGSQRPIKRAALLNCFIHIVMCFPSMVRNESGSVYIPVPEDQIAHNYLLGGMKVSPPTNLHFSPGIQCSTPVHRSGLDSALSRQYPMK